MKPCCRCKATKPFSEFHRDRSRKDGYAQQCKDCKRHYAKTPQALAYREAYQNSERHKEVERRSRQKHAARIRARKEARRIAGKAKLDQIKLERGCIDCGYREHPAALDFDHRDPAQKVEIISQIVGKNWDRVMAEAAKCDVRCANCHRIRTVEGGQSKAISRTWADRQGVLL